MSSHKFTITVEVDDDVLRAHNEYAERTASGLPVPADPAEWDERDLTLALEQEIGLVDSIDGYESRS